MMMLHVEEVLYCSDYILYVKFSNGAEGEIDLGGELEGEMFEPLRNLENFKRFKVDPELETIVWENGADLAPEFLYEKLKLSKKLRETGRWGR